MVAMREDHGCYELCERSCCLPPDKWPRLGTHGLVILRRNGNNLCDNS